MLKKKIKKKIIFISQRSSLSTDADKTGASPGSGVALCRWWKVLPLKCSHFIIPNNRYPELYERLDAGLNYLFSAWLLFYYSDKTSAE